MRSSFRRRFGCAPSSYLKVKCGVGQTRTVDQQVNSLLLYHVSRHLSNATELRRRCCRCQISCVFGFCLQRFEFKLIYVTRQSAKGERRALIYSGRLPLHLIDKHILQELIDQKLSTVQIAELLHRSPSCVHYWERGLGLRRAFGPTVRGGGQDHPKNWQPSLFEARSLIEGV